MEKLELNHDEMEQIKRMQTTIDLTLVRFANRSDLSGDDLLDDPTICLLSSISSSIEELIERYVNQKTDLT